MTNRGDATNPARYRGRKRLRHHCAAPDWEPSLEGTKGRPPAAAPHTADDPARAQGEANPQAKLGGGDRACYNHASPLGLL